MVNNCGVVTDGSGDALLVDTTSTEKRNRALLAEVAGVADRGPRIAVNTHHHPDHTYGNGFLPASTTIIGHHLCREGVLRAGLKATEELPRGLRRPGRPPAGPHRRQRHHPAPRRVPRRAPGHGARPLHPRHRRLAARAEGLLRRRPGVLGRPPDLPGGFDGRLPHGRPADARPRAERPAPGPRSRLSWGRGGPGARRPRGVRRLDRGDRRASRTPPACRPWRRPRSTRAARTPTGRRPSGWSATCTAPTPRSTRRTSLRSPCASRPSGRRWSRSTAVPIACHA